MVRSQDRERRANLKIGLAVALVLWASPAVSGDWLERGVLAASMADLLSTEHMLSGCAGCYERNPLGQTRGSRIALKAASGVLVTVVNRKIEKKHPKAAKVFRIILIGAYTGAAVHNMRLSQKH